MTNRNKEVEKKTKKKKNKTSNCVFVLRTRVDLACCFVVVCRSRFTCHQ